MPYAFTLNSHKLRNYRIYGNTVDSESVGDLVTEGEHAEKYCVPITVEGKNIYNPLTEWYLNNTDNVSAKTDSSTNRIKSDIIKINNNRETIVISGLPSELSVLTFRFYDIDKNSISGNSSGNIPSSAQYVSILCGGENLSADTKTLIKNCSVQLEYGNQSTAYEPYVETQTVNIYLDEPIAEGEYIDFREQKQYFADETSENVSLPAIPTIDGTNILSVETTVQPSKIWIQGNISEIETVSVQALQANMQSLQPLSIDDENLELDVMPTDNSLQPDVMPIEKPVLNLNDVSEIENAEIERGVESAE